METTIYLVRHGTVHNPRHVLYGRLPRYHLSREGRLEAQRTALFLAGKGIAAIYASPLLRARQTARIIAAQLPCAPMHVSRLLTEVRTSRQGETISVARPHFDLYETTTKQDQETIGEILGRMCKILKRIFAKHLGGKVACVTHADPIVITVAGFLGVPLAPASLRELIFPSPASVTKIVFGDSMRVIRVIYFDPSDLQKGVPIPVR
jgi:broad specificity phosphatase PhoE